MDTGRTLSRRTVLRLLALGSGGVAAAGLLEACGGSSSPGTATTASGAATKAATTASGSSQATSSAATPAKVASPAASTAASPAAKSGSSAAFNVEPAKNKGGQLISGNSSDAQTLNPVLSHDTSSGANIDQIFEGVVNGDPSNAAPVGRLAKSFDISPDGTVYNFVFNDGIKWHDGETFSSADVKFTYDLFLNPETNSPRTGTLTQYISKVEVPDASHAVFTLKTPNASFLINYMSYGIVPQHILKDVAPKDVAQHAFSTGKKGVTIGTGPFMFEEWVKDDHITLVKNPNYWRGEPNLDRWVYKVVPNTTVLGQQLKTGEIDYGLVDPGDVADMQKEQSITVKIYDTFSCTFWCYQLDPAKATVFQDKAVRQALLYALDRKSMIDAINFGYASLAIGTIPTISWAYNPDGIQNKYPYDMNKAKQLLDQAGWQAGADGIRAKNGVQLKFEMITNQGNKQRESLLQIMQQSWKDIGVDATPRLIQFPQLVTQITNQRTFDVFLVGFNFTQDPDESQLFASTSANPGGFNGFLFKNAQVDQVLSQAASTLDQGKRKQLYAQFQDLMNDQVPAPILVFNKGLWAVSKRVQGVNNTVFGSYNQYGSRSLFFKDVWVTDQK